MHPKPTTTPSHACPQCGQAVQCALAAGEADCWCFRLPETLPVPATGACWCARCLTTAATAATEQADTCSGSLKAPANNTETEPAP